jgi:photosystem II stability/assembly factor-like uncharacterized protein
MRTEDAGSSWNTIYNPGNQYFRDAAFSDSKCGLIVASSGEIMHTINGGVYLEEVFKDNGKQFFSIAVLNKDTYITSGADGLIMKTTDKGQTDWQELSSGVHTTLYSLSFIDEQTGWACGSGGTILMTTDAGAKWTKLTSETGYDLYDIDFIDQNNGIAVGFNGLVLRTTDGGQNWKEIPQFTQKTLHSVAFNKFGNNKNIGLIMGIDGTAFKTENGGQNWKKLNTKNTRIFFSAQVLSDLVFVAAGQYGTIIQTQSRGDYWFVNQRGEGPVANAWSLRYFGEPGDEDIFLATEAGLFVLREPSDVDEFEQYITNDNALSVSFTGNTLKLSYHLQHTDLNQKLLFRICDIKGNTLYQNLYSPDNTEIQRFIYDLNFPAGVYLCQVIESCKSSVRVIIRN